MSKETNLVEQLKSNGYIEVSEKFYIKPVDAHAVSYDVYEIKPSKSPRHPDGKLDDLAYGCSLGRALQLIAHKQAEGASDIVELTEQIIKFETEFLKKVEDIVKANK